MKALTHDQHMQLLALVHELSQGYISRAEYRRRCAEICGPDGGTDWERVLWALSVQDAERN